MTHRIYLGLGSNLGDRLANLGAAAAALPTAVEVLRQSPIYETEPWGYADQPAFLNCVIEAQTLLEPPALLAYLKQIEASLGRTPTFRYGPRCIDLDILFYDDLILETAGLTIPHPRLHERAFVLAPLADLAANLRHPVLGKRVEDLLSEVNQRGVKLYVSNS